MSRRRAYSGSGGGDPYAAARENLAEERFAQSSQNASDRLSLSQESNLLHKAQMVFEIVKARQAIEDKRDQTMHAAALIQGMGSLNINDPNYEQKRAQILSDHAAGLKLAQPYLTQKDSIWESQQKANQTKADAFSPLNVGRSAADLKTAIAGLDSLASQFGDKVPPELQAAKTNLTAYAAAMSQKAVENIKGGATPQTSAVQDLANAPAATAALNAAPGQPAAPATTPAAISTQNAAQFLQSIGVGNPSPAPAAAPTAQPVQAAPSGIPDSANAAVSPTPSENDEETP